jgi:hypothetical protein
MHAISDRGLTPKCRERTRQNCRSLEWISRATSGTMRCVSDSGLRAGRSRWRLGHTLLTLALTSTVLAACHYDFDESTLEQSHVSGVAPLDGGGFAFAI